MPVFSEPQVGGPLGAHLPTKLGAESAKESRTELHARLLYAGSVVILKHKRLSATDIPALASMKNVAKCDTWCELQNPVNHRVFERKLRLRPLG